MLIDGRMGSPFRPGSDKAEEAYATVTTTHQNLYFDLLTFAHQLHVNMFCASNAIFESVFMGGPAFKNPTEIHSWR
jgi:hypothetical protein